MALGLSGIETPSYIFMTIFACFIALSVFIEKFLDFIKDLMLKAKRNGLKAALDAVVSEITMLGFISLFLTAVEEPLLKLCVDEKYYNKHWIPIRMVGKCDSCFEHTRGLSTYQQWRGECAPHFHESHDGSPFEEEGHEAVMYGVQRKLQNHEHGWRKCGEGELPFVSEKTVHEVHIAIFLISVTHAAIVIIMAVMANIRLARWRKWQIDYKNSIIAVNPATRKVLEIPKEGSPSSLEIGNTEAAESELLLPTSSEKKNIRTTAERIAEALNSLPLGPVPRADGPSDLSSPMGRSPITRTITTKCGTTFKIVGGDEESDDSFPSVDHTPPVRYKEWLISIFRQFWSPITVHQFMGLRAAFIQCHRRPEDFNFEEYLVRAIDDDIGKVVRIPLLGWVILICAYIVWTPLQYTAWAILGSTLVLELLVLVVSAKLVRIVRCVTWDGKVNDLDPCFFWASEPKLLLPIVRIALFLNSVCFAMVFLLSWQYGFRSCAFASKIDVNSFIHHSAGPLVIIFNVVCFLHIGWILIPLYTVTVHMGSTHFSHHLFEGRVLDAFKDLLEKARQRAKEQKAMAHRISDFETEEESLQEQTG